MFDYKVRPILDSTIDYLSRNPDARMTFADFGFVYMYLHDAGVPQNIRDDRKNRIQDLFKSKQMEAANGGFVLPDFAVTTHDELLSNWQLGNRWIRDQFNATTSSMWSIDQFGHSRTATRLAKECGFQENFINRVIHKYQAIFRKGGDIIFRWRYGDEPGDSMTTLQLEQHYEILRFRVDASTWGASEFMMNMREQILNDDFNFMDSCQEYFKFVERWTNYTKSRVKLIPFGGDFHFENYGNTIHFIEQLTNCVKSNNISGRFGGKFSVRTTTLSEFLKALKADFIERNVSIKSFTFDESENFQENSTVNTSTANKSRNYGDLLPYTENLYNSENRIAWSGYYTTAPFGKKVMRSHGEFHRGMRSIFATKTLQRIIPNRIATGGQLSNSTNQTIVMARQVLSGLEESDWATLANLHHDTITGVSTNFVNKHYIIRSQLNMEQCRLDWKPFFNSLIEVMVDESSLTTI